MTRAEFAQEIHKKYLEDESIDIGLRMETYDALFHTGTKLIEYFGSHENILVSVSGGSDSDCIVHLICTYFPEYLDKCHFVFVNTGLEYQATKDHIKYNEKRYGITITQKRGRSVVSVVREYGLPILSKIKSERIRVYCENPEGWAKKYIYADEAMKEKMRNDMIFTQNQIKLVEHIKENGIKISAMCCDKSKKDPLFKYCKEHDIELDVTGERKAEGGQRALSHKSCFEEGNHGMDKYMPLWWWSDDAKALYKKIEGIRYSDCYEVYGMRRTGCVGCPFNLQIAKDLQAMYEYEPQLYKACMNVFGESYRLMDEFKCRRKKCLPEFMQMTLTGEIERNGKE